MDGPRVLYLSKKEKEKENGPIVFFLMKIGPIVIRLHFSACEIILKNPGIEFAMRKSGMHFWGVWQWDKTGWGGSVTETTCMKWPFTFWF